MSWGYKITILYLGFVTLIVSMVVMTTKQNTDLDSKDYYEKELKFQDKIDKINRTSVLKEQLTWNLGAEKLTLKFPGEFDGKHKSGEIYFFRPSDASLDTTMVLRQDTSSVEELSLLGLKKGVYRIECSWNANETEYYNEGVIQIK